MTAGVADGFIAHGVLLAEGHGRTGAPTASCLTVPPDALTSPAQRQHHQTAVAVFSGSAHRLANNQASHSLRIRLITEAEYDYSVEMKGKILFTAYPSPSLRLHLEPSLYTSTQTFRHN